MSQTIKPARGARAHRAALALVAAAATLCPAAAANALAAPHKPAPPTHLVASAVTRNALSLTWRRSPGRIVRYRVYRNRREIGRTSAARFAVTGLRCGTNYAFSVRAADGAGRLSPRAVRWARTAACAPPDTEAPSAPSGLAQSEPSTTGLDLTWLPSTDNVRVSAYRVSRDGVPIARTAETSISVGGLTCGTSYRFTVVAYEAPRHRVLHCARDLSCA
jgi:chitinase